MGENKKVLDSTVYRMLLEFIKREGVETLKDFWIDYAKIQEEDLLLRALCDGKHPTLTLVRKHKAVAGFVKDLNISYPCFLLDRGLPKLLDSITEENVSKQIECARLLEDLRISDVDLGFDAYGSKNGRQTIIKCDSDGEIVGVSKLYSNGELDYTFSHQYGGWTEYKTRVDFCSDSGNFLLGVANIITRDQERWIRLTDFNFDTSLLPSEEELSRNAEPKTLTDSKVYVKR